MVRHFAYLAGARGASAISIAVAFILLARDVGPSTFGLFAALLAIQQVLAGVFSLNAPAFVAREVSLGQLDVVRAAIRVNAVAAVCAVVIFAVVAGIASSGLVLIALLVCALAGAFDVVSDARLAVPIASRQVVVPVIAIVVRATLLMIVFWPLSRFMDALVAVALGRLVSSLACYLIGIIYVRTTVSSRNAPMLDTFRTMLPVGVAGSVGAIRNLDTTLVAALGGAVSGGYYSAASRVLAPAGIAAGALSSVAMGRAATASSSALRRRFDHVFLAMCALTVIPLVTLPFSDDLMLLIFGPEFAAAGLLLTLTLMRVGSLSLGPVQSTLLQARYHESVVTNNAVVVTILTLVAVSVGAALAGGVGAAIGYLAVSVCGFTRLWFVGRGKLRID